MKSVNKIAILNICSVILLRGISFFTTPIFTRMLGASQYGKYSIFNSRLDIIMCFVCLGVISSIGTGIYEFKEKYTEFRSSILLLATVIGLGFIVLFNLFIHKLSDILGYDIYLIEILLILAVAHNIINLVQHACIYEKRAEINFVLSAILSISSILISLYLIPRFSEESKYLGRVLGMFIPYIIIALICWLVIYLKKPTLFHKEYTIYGLLYGIPVVFHTASASVLGQADRIMMLRMGIQDTEIGIYSLYYTFVNILNIILNALSNSWVPFYYDDVSEKRWKPLNLRCKNIIELFTVLSVGFLLLSREVSYLFANQEFWGGVTVIPTLVIAVYFIFLYQFPVSYEFYYKKTKVVAIGTISAALINIILNYLMIDTWGMYGAGISTAISYGILFIMHFIIANKISNIKYHLPIKYFVIGLLGVLLGTILFYVLSGQWLIRWGLGILIGIYEFHKILKRKSIY